MKYEVIADYPFNKHFKVGDILELQWNTEANGYSMGKVDSLDSSETYTHTLHFDAQWLNKYSAIFKKLT